MGSVQEEEDGKPLMIACLPAVLGVGLRRKEWGFERLRVFKVVMQKFEKSNFCITTLKTFLWHSHEQSINTATYS